MRLDGLSVLVIGAGIGGLAAALGLARRGADVTVLEQAPAIREVGAGLQISPNGFAVLRALGLDADLRRVAVQARAVALHDYRGAPVARLDLQRLPDPDYHFVHRADLIDILARGARAAGVRLRLRQRVATVVPGAPAPRVHLAPGIALGADLVIGADGLHSRARAALEETGVPRFTGQVAWRAVVPNHTDQDAEAQVHMGPGRHLVCYPLRQGRLLNLVAVQERAAWSAESWSQQDDPQALRAAFGDFSDAVQRRLAAVDRVHLWGLFRHPVARVWQAGGVALLGDAAHPTLPFMAQGASLALEDGWVLAAALAPARDLQDGLARYQAVRAPRATRVVAAADGNAWKYHLRLPPLRWAAHLALRGASRLAPGAMMRQYDWIYGHDVTRDPV